MDLFVNILERPDRLTSENVVEYIEYLTNSDPMAYICLQHEIINRTQENTDIDNWKKWFREGNFARIREGLLTVTIDDTNRPVILGELVRMFDDAIKEADIRIIEAKKMCDVIKKYQSLISLYEPLMEVVPKIKSIHDFFVSAANRISNPLKVFSDHPHMLCWENLKCCVWANFSIDIPDNIVKYFDDHLGKLEDIYETLPFYEYIKREDVTIVTQEMDEVFYKYLKSSNLHRYNWFFNNFSYLDIMFINQNNIQKKIAMLNKAYGHGYSIKKGCQQKICDAISMMRQRSLKLSIIVKSLEEATIQTHQVDENVLFDIVSYMHQILVLPIPNKKCISDEHLQEKIMQVLNGVTHILLKHLDTVNRYKPLRTDFKHEKTVKLFFQCGRLIKENHVFSYFQIKNIEINHLLLKHKINNQAVPRVAQFYYNSPNNLYDCD